MKATVESDVPYIEVSLSRARLRDVYKALLLQDLELALDQKVEQELWNNCYKEILINIILLNIFSHLRLLFKKIILRHFLSKSKEPYQSIAGKTKVSDDESGNSPGGVAQFDRITRGRLRVLFEASR